MVLFSAALSLAGIYTLGWRLRVPRHLLPLLLLISPFFAWTHASLMPQSTVMLFSIGLLLLYVRGRQEGERLTLVGAGLCWAALYVTDPAAALCLALPFGVDVWAVISRNRRDLWHWQAGAGICFAAFLGILALKGYHHTVTGHSSVSTQEIYESSEGWGFGMRRTQGGGIEPVEHSLRKGFADLSGQLRDLDRWLLGGFPGFLILWFGLWVHGWNRRWSSLLLGAVVVTGLAQVGYWDAQRSVVGPLAYAAVLPFLLTGGALGLSRIWRKMQARRPQRLLVFGGMGIGLAYMALPFHVRAAGQMRETTRQASELLAHLEKATGPLMVFWEEDTRNLPMSLQATGLLNPYGRESRVLMLQAAPEDRAALAVAHVDRQAFTVNLPAATLQPYQGFFEGYHRVAANSHHSLDTGENRDTARVVDGTVHRKGFLFFGWYPFVPPGEVECRFNLRWSGGAEDAPLRLEVVTDYGQRVLAEKVLSPGLESTELRFDLKDVRQVEPRVYFGGSGEAVLRSVELIPVPSAPGNAFLDPGL
jgi:hypothetical protein